MVASSGLSGQIGYADENTYGTYAAPTDFTEFISEGLELDITRVESKGIRTGRRVQHRWAPGTRSVQGSIDFEVHPLAIGHWLKHTIGDPVTTGAGPYTHTWAQIGQIDDKSFTTQIVRPNIDGTEDVQSYLGCQVTELEMSAGLDEYVMGKASIYGADLDGGQSKAAQTLPLGDPFIFTQATCAVLTDQPVEAFKLNIKTGLETGRHRLRATNPQLPRQAKEAGYFEISGELDYGERSGGIYDLFPTGTVLPIQFDFDNGTDSLRIVLTARFDKPTGNTINGPELPTLGLPFVARHATSDASAFNAVLVNSASSI